MASAQENILLFRISHAELFYKKDFFKNFTKFTGRHLEFCIILKNIYFVKQLQTASSVYCQANKYQPGKR